MAKNKYDELVNGGEEELPVEFDLDGGSDPDSAANIDFGVIGSNIAEEDAELRPEKGAQHAKDDIPDYMRHSRKMRRILIAVIIILVCLLIAGGVLIFQLIQTSNNAATQQTQNQISDIESINNSTPKDSSSTTTKKTNVPDLVSLLGLNVDQAIEVLQHGAQVTSTIDVNEEGSAIRAEVRIALTAEPSDSKSGSPMVYLSLNEEGLAIQAGYSVATSSLGYGSLSFSDAIENEHIVEKTLEEAGLEVAENSAVLPDDKMQYSTYASDGVTLTKENCSFEGVGSTAEGAEHSWTAILSYDYTTANATGNLIDTIRTIYVYIS